MKRMINRDVKHLLVEDQRPINDDRRAAEGIVISIAIGLIAMIFASIFTWALLEALSHDAYPAPENLGELNLSPGQGPYIHFDNGDEISLATVSVER